MDTINVKLPRDLKSAEIHIFSDLHIGDRSCDIDHIKERIERVKNTPNAYVILNGDIMNNATKTSISDSYAETMSPMEQMTLFLQLFEPIKDRILAITQGNHENRTYITQGVDLTSLMATQLGIPERYAKNMAVIFLKIGEHKKADCSMAPNVYVIACIHGSGGGRKEGAKAIRLADMANVVDADIYIHGHTHLPMVMKNGFFRTDISNGRVFHIERLFVNTSAELNYGGYSEQYEFKPSSNECPVIYISGEEKKASAKL